MGSLKSKSTKLKNSINNLKKGELKILLFNSSVASEIGLAREAKKRLGNNGFNKDKIIARNDIIGPTSSVYSYCKSEGDKKILAEIHQIIFDDKRVLWGDTSEIANRRSNKLIWKYFQEGRADIIIRIPNEY